MVHNIEQKLFRIREWSGRSSRSYIPPVHLIQVQCSKPKSNIGAFHLAYFANVTSDKKGYDLVKMYGNTLSVQ